METVTEHLWAEHYGGTCTTLAHLRQELVAMETVTERLWADIMALYLEHVLL